MRRKFRRRRTFRRRRRRGYNYTQQAGRFGGYGPRRFGASRMVLRGPQASIMPDKLLVKIPYTTGLNLTGTGVAAVRTFSGNSCFDPDVTGVGSQPFGFDQWSAFYSKYRVYGSSIKVLARANYVAADPNKMFMLVVIPTTYETVDTNYVDITGEPYVKTKVLPNSNAGYPCTIKSYMSTRKIFGVTRAQSADTDYAALNTASPSIQWYWQVVCDEATSAAINPDCLIYVKIMYYVEFFSRVNIDRS